MRGSVQHMPMEYLLNNDMSALSHYLRQSMVDHDRRLQFISSGETKSRCFNRSGAKTEMGRDWTRPGMAVEQNS